MWIEVLPKKIIHHKVIISKNMNCPKKKNSVNTNKSNIKNKNCIWEKVSTLQKFHGGKVPPGPHLFNWINPDIFFIIKILIHRIIIANNIII